MRWPDVDGGDIGARARKRNASMYLGVQRRQRLVGAMECQVNPWFVAGHRVR